jgi:hypothetical protein
MAQVRNIVILIPDLHSRMKFEPRYVLPIIERLWRARLRDESDPVRVSPTPPHMKPDEIRKCDCSEEYARLRASYPRDPATGQPLFEAVYPTYGDFERAFANAVDELKPRAAASAPTSLQAIDDSLSVTIEAKE